MEDDGEGDRRGGDIERLLLLLLLRLRLGDRSLGSGTLSYCYQPPGIFLRRESLEEIRDSPEQSHHTSSNPYTGSSTTNTIHARIVPPPVDIHPYQVVPQVISRQVLIEYQLP
jgi:hypothetical protein